MELDHAIRGILDDVIDAVSIQKTVEAHAADASNQRFAFLLRELKFSADSIRLGIESWTNEMKEWKRKSLELNVKETIADLDNMLDRKENMLDRLHDEYKIAEDQYERSVTAHKNLLDQFMVIHTGFIGSFQTCYENEIDQMIKTFFVECRTRERLDKECKTYSMNVMHGKSLLTRFTLADKSEKFTREKNALKAIVTISGENLVAKSAQNIEQIYNESLKVIRLLSNCLNGKQNEEAYQANKSRLEIDQRQIEELEEKIYMRKNYLRKLNSKFNRFQEYAMENLTELRSRYEISLERNNILQAKTKQIFHGMDDDLKHMVSVANDSLHELDKQAKMCRNIMTVFNICQKMITTHERLHCGTYAGDDTSSDGITELELFWHEVGIIGNSILVLEKEFSTLQMENSILQKKIRRYMSDHKTSKFAF